MAPDILLKEVRKIGRQAARWVRAERPLGRVGVSATKTSPTDVVTALDEACETIIRNAILAWRPDDGFLGEEGNEHQGKSGVTWIVDPIDGTVNFMYGVGGYAISIGGQQDGRTIVGYIVNIATGEEFGAIAGQGSWRWQHPQAEEQLQLAGPPLVPIDEMLVATGFNYTPEMRAKQGQAVAHLLPHIRDIRRLGSAALDLAAVAQGTLDAYVEQGLKPWDLAAGALIAAEAGLTVTGLDGEANERLTIVCRSEVAGKFIDLVKRCGF